MFPFSFIVILFPYFFIFIGNDKNGKIKKKMIPEYNAKYSVEELVLFSNDKDKNIMKLNSDLK